MLYICLKRFLLRESRPLKSLENNANILLFNVWNMQNGFVV
jgi:hypothetical protein